MRVKQLWDFLPVPSKLKLLWDRITVSRLTIIYFAFAVVHCIVQVVLQAQAFSVNAQAAGMLSNIIYQGGARINGFPVLAKDLRVCSTVPKGWNTDGCEVIWGGNAFNPAASAAAAAARSSRSATHSTSSAAPSSVSSSVSSSSVTSAQANSASASSVRLASASAFPSPASKSSAIFTPLVPAPAAPAVAPLGKVAVEVSSTLTTTVFVTAAPSATLAPVSKRAHSEFGTIKSVEVNGTKEVQVTGFGYDHETMNLSQKCLVAFNWPLMHLDNTKREDVTFILFQVWVLGMSIVAILNESIPHIIASLLTHTLATGWASYQIWHTSDFRADFNRLTTNGACDGENLLQTYWTARSDVEIPILVLNVVSLLVSAFLTWRIVKLFGWQTFKRIGASLAINRIYKIVLSLSIIIQLAIFFVVASAGVWIDQLQNGWIAVMASHRSLYEGLVIGVCVLLVPWLTLGWISVRREKRYAMIVFLVLCLGYLGGAGGMLKANTFRWTYINWPFFALIFTAGAILVLMAFILGVLCRINFGKGLPRYLNAEEPLPGDDFISVTKDGESTIVAYSRPTSDGSMYDDEKVEFPSPIGPGGPLPTFAAAYGGGVRAPPPAHARSPSQRSAARELPQLERVDSHRSARSVGSVRSTASEDTMRGKRWVIE